MRFSYNPPYRLVEKNMSFWRRLFSFNTVAYEKNNRSVEFATIDTLLSYVSLFTRGTTHSCFAYSTDTQAKSIVSPKHAYRRGFTVTRARKSLLIEGSHAALAEIEFPQYVSNDKEQVTLRIKVIVRDLCNLVSSLKNSSGDLPNARQLLPEVEEDGSNLVVYYPKVHVNWNKQLGKFTVESAGEVLGETNNWMEARDISLMAARGLRPLKKALPE